MEVDYHAVVVTLSANLAALRLEHAQQDKVISELIDLQRRHDSDLVALREANEALKRDNETKASIIERFERDIVDMEVEVEEAKLKVQEMQQLLNRANALPAPPAPGSPEAAAAATRVMLPVGIPQSAKKKKPTSPAPSSSPKTVLGWRSILLAREIQQHSLEPQPPATIRHWKGKKMPPEVPLVSAVAASADGTLFATGGADGAVIVYDTSSWRVAASFPRHTGVVSSIAITRGATRVASCSNDQTTRVFSMATKLQEHCFHEKAVMCAVAFSVEGMALASGGGNETINVRSTESGDLIFSIPCASWVTSLHFCQSGMHLAASFGTTAAVFTESGTLLMKAEPDGKRMLPGPVRSVTMTPDGSYLISAGDDGTISVWSVAMGSFVTKMSAPTASPSAVLSLCFSPEGKLLVSCGKEPHFCVWDPQTWRLVEKLQLPCPASGVAVAHTEADSFGTYYLRIGIACRDGVFRIFQ